MVILLLNTLCLSERHLLQVITAALFVSNGVDGIRKDSSNLLGRHELGPPTHNMYDSVLATGTSRRFAALTAVASSVNVATFSHEKRTPEGDVPLKSTDH
jgi:hypothetical protein